MRRPLTVRMFENDVPLRDVPRALRVLGGFFVGIVLPLWLFYPARRRRP